jgi:hypothetical protein
MNQPVRNYTITITEPITDTRCIKYVKMINIQATAQEAKVILDQTKAEWPKHQVGLKWRC